jgi:ubiquinone/menaquinone biosynthesis C-methylase UbiE
MFTTRSQKPERIDTGDYTTAEYDQFLIDIRLVNRFAGDNRALKKSLLREIESDDLQTFSVLDVGAGSGELLRVISKFAAIQRRIARLTGLELNPRSAQSILEESQNYPEINAIRSDALNLPFSNNSFDFVICSLFTHHLSDDQIIHSLREMSRVSKRKLIVIDLHRHPLAYAFYKVFCLAFRISQLVREDGSLSILKSFKLNELQKLAIEAGLLNANIKRSFPFRLVLEVKKL